MRGEDSPTMTQEPLRGLFLKKLLKCATPFQYCNLQPRRHNQNKQRPRGRGERRGNNSSSALFPFSLRAVAPHWNVDCEGILLRCGAFRSNDGLARNKNRVEGMIPCKRTWQHLKAGTD